jgi:hypothetical protein
LIGWKKKRKEERRWTYQLLQDLKQLMIDQGTNLPRSIQSSMALKGRENYPWTIECFLEDLFLVFEDLR